MYIIGKAPIERRMPPCRCPTNSLRMPHNHYVTNKRQSCKETRAQRSANMARIRSKDTKPELLVRHALHRLGFRFRLHARDLPGHPDIVLPKYQIIIQVKGCFWHGHTCVDGRLPKSNRAYWLPKLRKNKERDKRNDRKLRSLGWSVRNLWECQVCALSAKLLQELLASIIHKSNAR